MIDIPVSEIIAKIKLQRGLSDAEIQEKIKEKLDQLGNLISEEGAAHIVANELGVELVKTSGDVKIKDAYPGMRGITVIGKVVRKFEVRAFAKEGRNGKVGSFMLADETAQMRVTLWNDQADLLGQLTDGDVVRIKNAYVKENRGNRELHLNTDSKLEIKPVGVTVSVPQRSERWEQTERAPRVRKHISELAGDEENVELLATVVQVYDPRFFDVCPKCGKRVIHSEGGSKCAEHGVVAPDTNYVVSAFLDDGTGNIRATFWKQQTQRLTKKTHGEMLQYQENPAAFEQVKADLLGNIVKAVGKCKKNETFDRVELTVNLIFSDVNPEEELSRLREESSAVIATLDAPAPVREAMSRVVAEPVTASKVVVEAEAAVWREDGRGSGRGAQKANDDDEVKSNADEEVISLDDLEDLDEKL